MTPLFGSRNDHETRRSDDDGFRAEVGRLEALPVAQLATEIMLRGFGQMAQDPDAVTAGARDDAHGPSVGMIANTYTRPYMDRRIRIDTWLCDRLRCLIAEAVQALEHASLVRPQLLPNPGSSPVMKYALTRLGLSAMQQGTVERILTGS